MTTGAYEVNDDVQIYKIGGIFFAPLNLGVYHRATSA